MPDIIDRIYEASIIPELWVDVIDRMASVAECDGGFLFTVDSQHSIRMATSDCFRPLMNAFVKEGWMPRNIRAPRLAAMNYPGFIVDYDVVTPHEAETDPFYVDLLRKYGAGWATGTLIPVPSGDLIVLNLERSYERGPIDRAVLPVLDPFRPHLARSALLSVRLGLERARTMTETLSELGLPGAVLRINGTVLATNPLFEGLSKQFVSLAGGRIAIAHRPAHDLLHAAIASTVHNNTEQHPCSIAIPAVENNPACIAHLVPVRRQARDIFSGAAILLVVTTLTGPHAPSAHVLNGLFDLSPAEAKVARGLVEGMTVEEIARVSNLSRETIRGQLKAVLGKTGTRRQAELVGLLAGAQIGRGARAES